MTGTPSVRGRAFFGLALSLALAAGLATAPALLAQTDVTTSRISGTVRDTDGGALPGVSVEGRNQGTGLVQTAVTRSDGFYQLINGQDLARARRNGWLSAFCRFIGQARVA